MSLVSTFSDNIPSSLVHCKKQEGCANSYQCCRVEVESDSEA